MIALKDIFLYGIGDVETALRLDVTRGGTLSESYSVHDGARLGIHQFQLDMFLLAPNHLTCTIVMVWKHFPISVANCTLTFRQGKDSLSMTQQYPNGEKIISPGTVIVSAGGEVSDVKKVVSPVVINDKHSSLYHIDFSFDELRLGGSAFAQSLGKVGDDVPTVKNPEYFAECFNAIQELIRRGWIMAGHDISAGGMITTLLEMCFGNKDGGMRINLYNMNSDDVVKTLFAENPGVIIQVSDDHKFDLKEYLEDIGVGFAKIGYPTPTERAMVIKNGDDEFAFDIDSLRDCWYKTSYLLDRKQSMNGMAKERFENYKKQPVEMKFNKNFTGKLSQYHITPNRKKVKNNRPKAAIIREKGTNGEREMA